MMPLLKTEEDKRTFFKQYDIFHNTARKFILESYFKQYCLYFPGPLIAAACLLLSARWYNITDQPISEVSTMTGSEYLKQIGINSMIRIDVNYGRLGSEIVT
jgi:hypothetical protein